MKPAAFEYRRPETLEAALALLADSGPQAKILAGGQSLVPMMNFRVARPDRLIDINRVAGLDGIHVDGDSLVIGAMARHRAVKESEVVAGAAPIIPAAYEWVAHRTIRNRGTLGGNLCHADPASEMPMLMQLLDAQLVVRSFDSARTVAASDFFRGVYETALEPDEMLVEIRIPLVPKGWGFGFHEVCLRKGDFAFCCAAALMKVSGGRVEKVSLAIGGLDSTALRLRDAEKALVGKLATPDAFAEATADATRKLQIVGDRRTPEEYRRDLALSLTRRALQDAANTSK
jgi:carbon-monoxide dehydrogenase medium subunit